MSERGHVFTGLEEEYGHVKGRRVRQFGGA